MTMISARSYSLKEARVGYSLGLEWRDIHSNERYIYQYSWIDLESSDDEEEPAEEELGKDLGMRGL